MRVARHVNLETAMANRPVGHQGVTYVSGTFCNLSVRVGPQYNGATSRTRTDDLRFTKPLLYQLSYRGSSRAPMAALPILNLTHAFEPYVRACAGGWLLTNRASPRRT